jgi:lysine biosynthesis protein LysW
MPDKDPNLMARCPECDSRIYFERRPDTGEIIVCPECEASLEIIRNNPIRLDWAYDEGERPAAGGGPAPEELFGLGAGGRDEVDEGEYGEDEDYSRY